MNSILEASFDLCNLETDVDVSRGIVISSRMVSYFAQLNLNREIGRTQKELQSVPPLGVLLRLDYDYGLGVVPPEFKIFLTDLALTQQNSNLFNHHQLVAAQ